jgi:hypothetical protein
MAWHNGEPIVFGYPLPPKLGGTRWMLQWTHTSWLRRPHCIEIDEDHKISYNGEFFHGSAEYQCTIVGGPVIGLQFSPVHNRGFLRRFVFSHISGTANYLYEHGDNYSCILMPLTQANNPFQVYPASSINPTTLNQEDNRHKRRRFTFTTDEEEEDLTSKDFQKAQDEFVEPSPTARRKAITLTAAYYKDSLLRSSLCRQPEGREHADNIIVNKVISAGSVEQKAQVTKEWCTLYKRPISTETTDPNDWD